MPADYYSSPTPEAILPRWAAYGCGAASLVALAVIFIGGAWLARGGFTDLMDLTLGMSLGEMRGMYAAGVPDERKRSLDAEIERMRQNLRDGNINVANMQPFLEGLRQAVRDESVTIEETVRLEETARKINERAAATAVPKNLPETR